MDNINKYSQGFKDKIKPKYDPETNEMTVKPFRDAHVALARASFAQQQKEEFFNEAFTDILSDIFQAWLRTEPHESKNREYLYHSALALGSVKSQLIKYEQYGANATYMMKSSEEQDEQGTN
jgi:hypothetical protein